MTRPCASGVDLGVRLAYPAPSMDAASIRADLEAYHQAAREVERLLAGEPSLLERKVMQISGWSPVQHAAHLTLANELVLKNLSSLARGSGLLVVYEAAQVPRALEILRAGRLPRGEAQSPRMVVPPLGMEARVAREWATKFTADLDAWTATLALEGAPKGYVPHQLLGPLDLAQWARFGLVHTRHHLAIAREILAVSS